MDLFIRPYLPRDFDEALNVDGRPSKRRADKLRLVEAGAFWCLVAEDDSGIVGFIIMEDLGDDDGKSHYMVQINVARKRKRIGTKLVVRAFETIRVGGHVSLCVNTDNTEAISFYESLGFKWSGYVKGYRKNQDKFWYCIDVK